jgi:hypothetical protein
VEPQGDGEIRVKGVPENPNQKKYNLAVKAALTKILGDSGAKAILFYIGELTPETFETKLRSILGNGAPIILTELTRQVQDDASPPTHHWLSGRG